MVLFPNGGLGRVLLAVILVSTLSYLVLNIVSFAGTSWISYRDVKIRFGLWRVCDTTTSGFCNQWSDNNYNSLLVNQTFNGTKPGYVRSSQALEIISLVFYVFAALFIIIGILDLEQLPFEVPFLIAAALLFICITFISASLGLMSVKGRRNHAAAFLDWAWWNGLVGLIMTIICFFSLICMILYMQFSSTSLSGRRISPKKQKGMYNQQSWNQAGPHSMAMVGVAPTTTQPHPIQYQYPYADYNQQSYPNYNQQSYADPNQYAQQMHLDQLWQEYYRNQAYQNSMMAYGDQSAAEQYYHQQQPSPIISELAQQYVNQANQMQYQNQLLDPYRQYIHDPYLVHNYL